jgi:hypothetical protein
VQNVLNFTLPDAPYSLWPSGRNRFAVTPRHQVVPVLGYIHQDADDSWSIERAGKILYFVRIIWRRSIGIIRSEARDQSCLATVRLAMQRENCMRGFGDLPRQQRGFVSFFKTVEV